MGRKKTRKINVWYNTTRMINGEKRKVRVKKKADGTESIKIIYPKKKNIPMDAKARKLKGIARASYLNAKRPASARVMDKKKRARDKTNPTSENIESWRKKPHLSDIEFVDSKF